MTWTLNYTKLPLGIWYDEPVTKQAVGEFNLTTLMPTFYHDLYKTPGRYLNMAR